MKNVKSDGRRGKDVRRGSLNKAPRVFNSQPKYGRKLLEHVQYSKRGVKMKYLKIGVSILGQNQFQVVF